MRLVQLSLISDFKGLIFREFCPDAKQNEDFPKEFYQRVASPMVDPPDCET